ncbi:MULTISPECIES: glycosyltransferase [unclassified Flavobacterium]|uniref:glycosyltransferase n=1 Tax=unclassified Flavobacterium TaxID=196869 RepID=UPI0012924232|nr:MULTISPECIES: glycosyltransferase [unclassified Flavobacterium]MQP51527.1 glycosyltransferase [Flavobacterium sp. LMO9]MQP61245.1 glycosyltransferase [Flavobacterium sp. LMO6]
MKEKKLISVILYLYNNENSILDFLSQITKQADLLFEQFEVIIVNDCSTDNSVKKIKSAEFLKSFQVSIIQMSFHQGVELSMNAGLDLSTGDFVYEFDSVVVDFDINLIESSYRKILEGYDIVTVSPKENDKISSKLFYKTYNFFSKSNHKLRTDRFRILSRRAINRAFSISATIPYRKAMYINSGLKIFNIEFEKIKSTKLYGEKQYLRNKTAIDALIIYTNLAFRLSVSISLLLLLSTLSIIIYTVFIYFGEDKPIEGWTTIMLLVSGSFSGLFLLIAFIIKYLSLILELVFKKKSYIQENIEKI